MASAMAMPKVSPLIGEARVAEDIHPSVTPGQLVGIELGATEAEAVA
jgi:hypothetical protein